MGKKVDQNLLLFGITLSAGLGFLFLWVFWLESFIFVSLLGMEITKTTLERWEFIFFGAVIISASLIVPIRRIKKSSEQLDLTQNALEGEQTLSKVFFNVDNSIILVVDPSNQIMQVNQRATELLGYKEEDVLGRDWINHLVPDKARGPLRKQFLSFVNDPSKQFARFSSKVLTKGKTEKLIEWQAAPLSDEKGQTYGTIISGQDLSEQERLSKELVATKKKYVPHVKKLTEELKISKKKYHNEAIKSANAKARFKFWFELEKILISISPEALSDSLEVDRRVKKTLQLFGGLSNVDQGYVYMFTEDATHIVNTHLWVSGEPYMEPDVEEEISTETFPWFKEKLFQNEIVNVPNVAQLPPAAEFEKDIYQTQGVKSLIQVPIIHNDGPIGYLGFESSQHEKAWDKDEIEILLILAKLFAKVFRQDAPTISAAEPGTPAVQGAPPAILKKEITLPPPQAGIKEEIRKARESFEKELKERVLQMEKNFSKAQAELKERKRKEIELVNTRDTLERKFSNQTQELEELKANMASETQARSKLENDLATAQKSHKESLQDSNKTKTEQATRNYEKSVSELEIKLKEREKDLTALTNHLKKEKWEKTSTQNQLISIKKTLKNQQEGYFSLEEANSTLQNDLAELKQLQVEIKNAKETIRNQEQEINSSSQTIEEQLQEIKETRQTAENQKEFIRESEQTIEEQLQKIQKAQQTIRSQQERIESSEQTAEEQLADIQKIQQTAENQKEQIEEFEEVIEIKKNEVLESQKIIQKQQLSLEQFLLDLEKKNNALKDIKMSREFYSSIMDRSGLILFVLSANFEILELAEESTIIFKENPASLLNQNFFKAVLPESKWERALDQVKGKLKSEDFASFESEVTLKDSRKGTFIWRIFKDIDRQGVIKNYTAVGQDLTESRNMEKIQKENESLVLSIVENSVDGFIIIDGNGIIQSFNKSASKIFGYTSSEVTGHNVSMLMPEPYSGEHDTYLRNYQETGKAKLVGGAPREFLGRHKDESTFPMELAVREIYQGSRKMFLGIVRDITKRKEFEVSLKESEEKISKLMEAETDVILIVNTADQYIVDFNQAALDVLGYDREEILKLQLSDISTDPDNATVSDNAKGLAGLFGQTSQTPLRYYKKKDGTVFPAQLTSSSFKTKEKDLEMLIIRDTSKVTRLEGHLKDSESHLKSILDNTSSAIYVKDTEGRYTMVNRAFEDLFKVQNDSIQDKTDFDIFPKELATLFKENDRKVLEIGSPLETEETIMHIGGARSYNSVKFPLRSSSGLIYGLAGVLTDTTDSIKRDHELFEIRNQLETKVEERIKGIQKLQHKIIRSVKLETSSQLASSISDQINVPVHGIRNILEQLSDRVSMQDIHKSLVTVAINECNRISNLIDDLKNYHSPELGNLEEVDLHKILEETILENKERFAENSITLEKHFAPDLPTIEGVAPQIEHAIKNLLQNAEESMAGRKGKILVGTEKNDINIKIYIQDTGCGIPPENLDSIFDPFFTTKSAFKRPGLGLLVSLGIVKSHSGDIDVQSQPGKGSTFTITLPFKIEK